MKRLISVAMLSLSAATVNAGLIDDGTWNGWTQIASEDKEGSFNYVAPGFGGQAFDAEYLFYKVSGTTLSLGLQTGFDIVDGHQIYGNKEYWAGDFALTLNGAQYAVDFGLGHCGWDERYGCASPQVDAAGVYTDVVWDEDVYYSASGPLAMASGDFVTGLSSNVAGSAVANGQTSYFRQVEFDISSFGLGNEFDLDIAWTMSCGNDEISGGDTVSVPEPGMVGLLAAGLVGLTVMRRKKA